MNVYSSVKSLLVPLPVVGLLSCVFVEKTWFACFLLSQCGQSVTVYIYIVLTVYGIIASFSLCNVH